MAISPDDTISILIIDDDKPHAQIVGEILDRPGYKRTIATSGVEGARKIEADAFDIILTDLRMGDLDGMSILKKARQVSPDSEILMITGSADVKTAVEAIKLGASHYLQKPVDKEELRAFIDKAAEKRRLTRSNRELREQLDEKFGFEGVVGNSPRMHDIITQLKAYASTRATVLILGENGTGKELVAKALHVNSPRKAKPFVAMNCAALNENLLDDEMFGHEAGAFTGADKIRKGRFEYAHGGTLFLDEIGDMPLSLQAKLLRVLENGEVSRLGSNDTIRVDVRLVAATNRNLQQMIADGKFRQDLYFRLKVGTLRLPALRERKEDIPLLTAHFLKEMNQRHGRKVTGVQEAVKKVFASYPWPGNVRELRNQIESMVVQDVDGTLGMDDIQEGDSMKSPLKSSNYTDLENTLIGKPMVEVERFYSEKALEIAEGNREVASKMLGIGERTLYRMIQEWKQLDKINDALMQTGNNIVEAAKLLEMKPDVLEKKLKKLHQTGEDD